MPADDGDRGFVNPFADEDDAEFVDPFADEELPVQPSTPQEPIIRVERLKALLMGYAEGGITDEAEVVQLYQMLVSDPDLKSRLPEFLYTHRTLKEFWSLFKSVASGTGSYERRREFLREQFAPLLSYLRGREASAKPKDVPPATSASNAHPPLVVGNHNAMNPIFKGRDFTVDPKLCFVLMPFGSPELQEVYEYKIRPALKRCKLRVERADDIYDNKPVMEDIWKQINRARLVVAELTGQNANVFYEVGICHTVGKQVILLAQTIDDVPFDLRQLRVIIYSTGVKGIDKMTKDLGKTVRNVLAETEDPTQPPVLGPKAVRGKSRLSFEQIRSRWNVVIEELKRARAATTAALTAEAVPLRCEEGTLVIGFKYSVLRDKWDKGENRQRLSKALESVFGKEMDVVAEVSE